MAMTSPAPSGHSALHLRIRLVGVQPEVWRRVIVPGSASMASLSEILLIAMGWNLTHSHVFRLTEKQPDAEFDERPAHALAGSAGDDDEDFEFAVDDESEAGTGDPFDFAPAHAAPAGAGAEPAHPGKHQHDAAQDFEFDDEDEDELDEENVTVLEALRDLFSFTLEYDFGNGWEHEVVVEHVDWYPTGLKFGVCFDGANACPPEDIGGPSGYAEFLDAIADPQHDEHAGYLDWVGGSFDSSFFDLTTCNALLQRVR
jgi:Plasmid pRiA4b ORF-3-like protein